MRDIGPTKPLPAALRYTAWYWGSEPELPQRFHTMLACYCTHDLANKFRGRIVDTWNYVKFLSTTKPQGGDWHGNNTIACNEQQAKNIL